MKRSIMIQKIKNQLLDLFPNEYPNGLEFEEDLEEKVSSLLSFLEFEGMKPPIEENCPVLFIPKGHVWEKE